MTPQPMPRTSHYIPALDGIRALAFLTVFAAHALPPIAYYIPATLGVTVFFFLSGYLITTLLLRELRATGTLSLRRFYLRRALRISVPLYVIYALAAAFACLFQPDAVGNLRGLLATLTFTYNYTTVLGVLAWVPLGLNVIWSLCVEEHFYLLFPLLLLWMHRRRLTTRLQTRLLVAFCLLELLWRVILVTRLHDPGLWTYFATDARLDSILWGAILALNDPLRHHLNDPLNAADPSPIPSPLPAAPSLAAASQSVASQPHPYPALTAAAASKSTGFTPQALAPILALALLLATLLPRSFLYKESLRYTLQALALCVLFPFLIANVHRPLLRWLQAPPLRYLGWVSYVLYLCHDVILDTLNRRWPGRFALTATLGFLASLAVATLLRYTVELPLQRLRNLLRAPRILPVPVD